MSYFVGEDGKRYEIFRSGGGKRLADEAGVALLGEIPIDPKVAEAGDTGEPIVSKDPGNPVSEAYRNLADVVARDSESRGGADQLPHVEL
jgi:ATP-binding protein involved in chromosome partitioning